jgi:PAS domain S-box-containing protein
MARSGLDNDKRLAHLEGVLDRLQDMIWTTDFDGRVTWVNQSVERILGWDVDDAVGRTVDEYLTPASIRILGDAIRTAITSTPPVDGFRERVDYIHRDGRQISCELRVTFVRDDHGRIAELDGVSRELTTGVLEPTP